MQHIHVCLALRQRCGSCWAFSTTGAVEGAYFTATNQSVSLSEEELVQCSKWGNEGCAGGEMTRAFGWIERNGICLETADPYTSGNGITGSCRDASATCASNVTIGGFTRVRRGDEDALHAAVAQQPVSVGIEANQHFFQVTLNTKAHTLRLALG